MTRSFVVVCEARADQETACGLADRVFLEQIEWLAPELLPHNRLWRGLEPSENMLLWRNIPKIATSLGIRIHGHFDGQPGQADAHAGRRALLVIMRQIESFDAILLIRDSDGDATRGIGLEQARNEVSIEAKIVIGVAHPMRECWVLAGFEPQNDEEVERLGAMRSALGFDPRRRDHELTAKDTSAKLSPKRVLSVLTQVDRDREIACWRSCGLMNLREQGEAVGLNDSLKEVNAMLVPLIRGY